MLLLRKGWRRFFSCYAHFEILRFITNELYKDIKFVSQLSQMTDEEFLTRLMISRLISCRWSLFIKTSENLWFFMFSGNFERNKWNEMG